ncbi:MAG: hypothetical protein ABF242_07920 [Flavobacteriales bacterium]
MNNSHIFQFQSDISTTEIPTELNNPLGSFIPEIAKIAAIEFQKLIEIESKNWGYDFDSEKGKMFGVLVIQNQDNSYCYIASVSGKLPNNIVCKHLVPSVFDESKSDYFLTKGMTELTEMGKRIGNSTNPAELEELTKERAKKSYELQQQLFSHYQFLNIEGEEKNVLEIFENYNKSTPPAAAGECAAPKLLQYALENNLKPIAIAEFWWGSQPGSNKKHRIFYPACKDRCKPILRFILD